LGDTAVRAGMSNAKQKELYGAVGSAGRVTVKVVPSPGVLSTRIAPLCKSTICFTIERPSPVPPDFLDRDLSTT